MISIPCGRGSLKITLRLVKKKIANAEGELKIPEKKREIIKHNI